jgi:hypothetical protein
MACRVRGGVVSGAKVFGRRDVRDRFGTFHRRAFLKNLNFKVWHRSKSSFKKISDSTVADLWVDWLKITKSYFRNTFLLFMQL